MKFFRVTFIFVLLLVVIFSFVACSGGETPVEPAGDLIDIPESYIISVDHGRSILGMYRAEINPDVGTFSIEPVDRSSAYHFNLTTLYPNVLTITGYGFIPNFWADIRLSHPLPGSGISAFDARVIAVLPANDGVSMIYPTMNVSANNSVLLEPDGYTKLWDHPGLPGNTNPFMAYFKDQPYRIWRSIATTEETRRWEMDLAGFGGPLNFFLIVDVSTNFPSPPQSVIDNAPEPVQIDAEISSGLTPDGGSATVEVTLLDWQGQSGIGGVRIEAPYLFTGVEYLSFDGAGPNPNEYSYSGTISNELHAPEGEYNLLVATWDQTSMIFNYMEFIANVSTGTVLNPVDVTPLV